MLRLLLLASALYGCLVGCGQSAPETFPVKGIVKYGEKVVPTGIVMFIAEVGGVRVNSTIRPDGAYEMLAPAGQYRVIVSAPQESSQAVAATKENWTETFSSTPAPYVPSVYGDPEMTTLKATVEASAENKLDVTIPLFGRR